jgi:hypothetical protein
MGYSRKQGKKRQSKKAKSKRVGGAGFFGFSFGADSCQSANDKVAAAKKAYDEAVAAQVEACKAENKDSGNSVSGMLSGAATALQSAMPSMPALPGSAPAPAPAQSGGKRRRRSRVGKRR